MQNKHKKNTHQSKNGSCNTFWEYRKNINEIHETQIYYHELCHEKNCSLDGGFDFFLQMLTQKKLKKVNPFERTYISHAWKNSPGVFIDPGPWSPGSTQGSSKCLAEEGLTTRPKVAFLLQGGVGWFKWCHCFSLGHYDVVMVQNQKPCFWNGRR